MLRYLIFSIIDDCMTLQCLCPWFRGQIGPDGNCMLQNGQPLVMAYRKEYRMMNDNERQRWHYALTVLKQNGEYGLFFDNSLSFQDLIFKDIVSTDLLVY
jgi:hypothetical protein